MFTFLSINPNLISPTQFQQVRIALNIPVLSIVSLFKSINPLSPTQILTTMFSHACKFPYNPFPS